MIMFLLEAFGFGEVFRYFQAFKWLRLIQTRLISMIMLVTMGNERTLLMIIVTHKRTKAAKHHRTKDRN